MDMIKVSSHETKEPVDMFIEGGEVFIMEEQLCTDIKTEETQSSLKYQNETLISLKRHAVEVQGNLISTTSNNAFDEQLDEHVISSKIVKRHETDQMQEPLDEFIDDEKVFIKEEPLIDDIKIEETQLMYETIDYSKYEIVEQQYQHTSAIIEKCEALEKSLMEDVPTFLSNETMLEEKETSKQSVEEDEKKLLNRAKLPYNCGACELSFAKKKQLVKHRKVHGKNLFHCKLCNKWFSRQTRFHDHVNEEHKKSATYKCARCERSFKMRRSLHEHTSKNHKPFQQQPKKSIALTCKTCGESFSRLDVLEIHMNNHEYSTAFICNLCGEMFKCQSSLDSHIKIIHRKKKRFEDPTKRLKRLKKLQEAKKKGPHSCNLCNRTFFSLAAKQNHLRRQCKECSLCFKEETSFKEHCLRHEGKYQFHCEVCNKGFVRKANLQFHMENHSGQHSYKCATCEKSFKKLVILKNHAIKVHGRPIFQINKKVTAQKEVEQDDVQFKYHCKVCNRGFHQRHQLIPHALVHSESRLHKCDTCGKSYKASYSLRRHKAIAHGIPIVSTANDGNGNQYKSKADLNLKNKAKEGIIKKEVALLENDLILCDDNKDENYAKEEFVDIAQKHTKLLKEVITETICDELVINSTIVKIMDISNEPQLEKLQVNNSKRRQQAKQPSRKSQKRKCNL